MTDEQREPGESFLAHRARLKAQRQRAEREARDEPPVAEAAVPSSPAPAAAPVTDADLPPVESLEAGSDFTQFLAEGVSDALRQAALRKLFHLPLFNLTDGLAEYDEDYTKFEKLGNVVTYQHRRMQPEQQGADAAAQPPELPADGLPEQAAAPGEAPPAEAAAADQETAAGTEPDDRDAEPVETVPVPDSDAVAPAGEEIPGKPGPD